MKKIFILIIRLYQMILSPFMNNSCRFFPTCSEYGMQAIQKHGSLKGAWLTCKRICKCHPFHKGGFDPIP